MRIVGVDCATDPKKTGLATCVLSEPPLRVENAGVGTPLAEFVASVHREPTPTLIALDAPLGWPGAMGEVFPDHKAGGPIPLAGDHLFNRETDRLVRSRVGKKPLEVGADRIARTALAALTALEDVRQVTGCRIPLAWASHLASPMEAIEVYPAATLLSREIAPKGYKAKGDRAGRKKILKALQDEVDCGEYEDVCLESADVLDAVVCLLAAKDFLVGEAPGPTDLSLARREGWIWVKSD